MSKLNAFKKLIKEAIREVLTEEGILNENRTNNIKTTPYNQGKMIVESTGNPLMDLINETRNDGGWMDMGTLNSSNTHNMGGNHFSGEHSVVGNVGDMLSSANKSGDMNQISIDVVPDFSGMMGAFKKQGGV